MANKMKAKAAKMLANHGKGTIRTAVSAWLKNLPSSPDDDMMHEWAEKKGYDIHKVEATVYSLAKEYLDSK